MCNIIQNVTSTVIVVRFINLHELLLYTVAQKEHFFFK